MSQFDPSTSNLAGIDRPTLQGWLLAAQTAMHDLMIGKNTASASYAQGDGSRSVTYSQADLASLNAYIQALKAQLGIASRRPARFLYR